MGVHNDGFCNLVTIIFKQEKFCMGDNRLVYQLNSLYFNVLRAYVIDFELGWERYLPLAKFIYDNSFQSSIKMAPYKALYGR
ncbi:Gag protease polyprotein [Gossypium australe]|uniref:Gag protease polyprotein n=1 Tax=Gossypium australe TaxID=47621 RepID=A0A5B6X2R8_9ROSI|nr:Gag protease polyprotein [Gossypium australe]